MMPITTRNHAAGSANIAASTSGISTSAVNTRCLNMLWAPELVAGAAEAPLPGVEICNGGVQRGSVEIGP